MAGSGILVQRHRLAAELHRRRLASGLSTYELARRLGISQSKASRIENGRLPASLAEAEQWARETGAAAEEIVSIVDRAERALTEAVAFRGSARDRLPDQQRGVAELEQSARVLRMFNPVIVPGLLQTPEYAHHIFLAQHPSDAPDLAAAVAARVDRQAILYNPDKRFEFVIGEPALRWRLGPVAGHLAQLDRIRLVATMPSVDVAVLPFDGELSVWHSHAFVLFDDASDDGGALVHVEAMGAALNLSDPPAVERYRGAFTALRAAAISGAEVLDLLARIMADLT
jgi:transcriptional regulator with XRE-family HTH domain